MQTMESDTAEATHIMLDILAPVSNTSLAKQMGMETPACNRQLRKLVRRGMARRHIVRGEQVFFPASYSYSRTLALLLQTYYPDRLVTCAEVAQMLGVDNSQAHVYLSRVTGVRRVDRGIYVYNGDDGDSHDQ